MVNGVEGLCEVGCDQDPLRFRDFVPKGPDRVYGSCSFFLCILAWMQSVLDASLQSPQIYCFDSLIPIVVIAIGLICSGRVGSSVFGTSLMTTLLKTQGCGRSAMSAVSLA